NLIHDGSDEVVGLFPNTKSGKVKNNKEQYGGESNTGFIRGVSNSQNQHGDSGSAARFFYCAKASKSERNRGCEGLEAKDNLDYEIDPEYPYKSGHRNDNNANQLYMGITGKPPTKQKNHHPTVKPIALMKYLIKLVSREGATILDPFAGSGTTGIACKHLNRKFILIEKEQEYCEIAKQRIINETRQLKLFN
ncbi:MAG TPA: site-specific DNA-methyltransferase, partial [Alphaproteobacteria bacterium]|nr:site-specific DNA-methyltransferase [Alphaproteobacteria bacterium]